MSFAPSKIVVRALNEYITTFSAPFTRSHLMEIGVRMTAIKTTSTSSSLSSSSSVSASASASASSSSRLSPLKSDLIIYNPIELNESLHSQLQSLGDVKYVITPSTVHHVYLENFMQHYPNALIISQAGMKEKHEGLAHRMHQLSDENNENDPNADQGVCMNVLKKYNLNECVDMIYFPDITHKEIVLFHKPTRSLLVGDMIWNMPPTEQYTHDPELLSGIMQTIANQNNPTGWMMKGLAWAMSSSSARFKRGIDKIIDEWKPDTLIPQHGDVIQSGALSKIKDALSWILNDSNTAVK